MGEGERYWPHSEPGSLLRNSIGAGEATQWLSMSTMKSKGPEFKSPAPRHKPNIDIVPVTAVLEVGEADEFQELLGQSAEAIW